MAKFKVGDKVRLIFNNTFDSLYKISATKGATAIVSGEEYSGINNRPPLIKVTWVRDKFSGNQSDGGYFVDMFELVEEEKPVSNPCVVTEVITTTKRTLKKAYIPLGGFNYPIVIGPAANGAAQAYVSGNIFDGIVTSDDIREFARQLTEIADVLDENETR